MQETEDRKTNPADIAAFRVDFHEWLGRLKRSQRLVAWQLAVGNKPSEVAQQFRLSTARISQLPA